MTIKNNDSLGFVVRVLADAGPGESDFRGTGTLVTAEQVLTCKHVAAEPDGHGGWTDLPLPKLRVQGAPGTPVAVSRAAFSPSWDLALLTLEKPLGAEPPAFLWGMTRALVPRLRTAQLSLFGYPRLEQGEALWQHAVGELLHMPSYREGSETLTLFQISGGLPKGCSGGPIVLPWGKGWAYLATAYLGGEQAAASRLIMADPVVEFLHGQGLGALPRLDATRTLSLTSVDPLLAARLIEHPEASEPLPNPYQGLEFFREEDAPYFFGRTADTSAVGPIRSRSAGVIGQVPTSIPGVISPAISEYPG